MKGSKDLLTSLLHTVQMGQTGIRSVQDNAHAQGLRQELDQELQEYDSIEKQALALAERRRWELTDVHPAVRKMADLMTRARLMGGDVDSKIAAMLIQGNTRGMILGVRNLRRCPESDENVNQLAQELLNRENINIQKCRQFL